MTTKQWTPPKNWRWMPGMLYRWDAPLGAGGCVADLGYARFDEFSPMREGRNTRPDFDDPATLGCLLALVREAWGEPTAHAQFYDGTWRVAWWNTDNFFWSYWPEDTYATEAEALLAALEAAT